MRQAPLRKPDQYLRVGTLLFANSVQDALKKRVLFHPLPIRHQVPRKRCFCRRKTDNKMVLCEGCDEWYHLDCVGLDEAEAQGADDWQCGYCQSALEEDGTRAWNLAIPQGKYKKPRVAKPRMDGKTPRALGITPEGMEMVDVGPSTWEEIVLTARAGAMKLRRAEEAYKKKAAQLVKAGGHHVVDQMGLGGVEPRPITNELLDDLIVNGDLGDEEGGEDDDIEEEGND